MTAVAVIWLLAAVLVAFLGGAFLKSADDTPKPGKKP